MSHINSVLLPQSDTDYYIWLGSTATSSIKVDIIGSGAHYIYAGVAAMAGLFATFFWNLTCLATKLFLQNSYSILLLLIVDLTLF